MNLWGRGRQRTICYYGEQVLVTLRLRYYYYITENVDAEGTRGKKRKNGLGLFLMIPDPRLQPFCLVFRRWIGGLAGVL